MKPLAISLGEPGGVGPEVAARALARFRPKGGALLFGDPQSVPLRFRRGLKNYVWKLIPARGWRLGRPTAGGGEAAYQAVCAAAKAVLGGQARGLVTAPLSKEGLKLAGHRVPGHTELLARLCGLKPEQVGMLLVGGGLRVFLVTRHLSLRRALGALTPRALDQALQLCAAGLKSRFGVGRPRLALAALNPHAGEGGTLGREEKDLLAPWVRRRSRSRAWSLAGPLAADTVFVRAQRGHFDAVLCLYHDQGLIPLKLLAFDSGVNVTLGLPFFRSSPDHGTAWDLAGKAKASDASMLEALRLADRHGA